jgi:hypothetical protein
MNHKSQRHTCITEKLLCSRNFPLKTKSLWSTSTTQEVINPSETPPRIQYAGTAAA